MPTEVLPALEGWAPNGKKIVGTYEKVPGVAIANSFYRVPLDGQIGVAYEGETRIWWDGQETQYDLYGQRLFVDEDDNLWPEPVIEWKPAPDEAEEEAFKP